MFGIVFLWTPPHFWALALMIRDHYANAQVPMLPVVRGDRETARQIAAVHRRDGRGDARAGRVRHRSASSTASSALVLGAVFAWMAWRALARDDEARRGGALFHYSLLYLALLFVAMAVDAVV